MIHTQRSGHALGTLHNVVASAHKRLTAMLRHCFCLWLSCFVRKVGKHYTIEVASSFFLTMAFQQGQQVDTGGCPPFLNGLLGMFVFDIFQIRNGCSQICSRCRAPICTPWLQTRAQALPALIHFLGGDRFNLPRKSTILTEHFRDFLLSIRANFLIVL